MHPGYIIAAAFLVLWIGLQVAQYIMNKRNKK